MTRPHPSSLAWHHATALCPPHADLIQDFQQPSHLPTSGLPTCPFARVPFFCHPTLNTHTFPRGSLAQDPAIPALASSSVATNRFVILLVWVGSSSTPLVSAAPAVVPAVNAHSVIVACIEFQTARGVGGPEESGRGHRAHVGACCWRLSGMGGADFGGHVKGRGGNWVQNWGSGPGQGVAQPRRQSQVRGARLTCPSAVPGRHLVPREVRMQCVWTAAEDRSEPWLATSLLNHSGPACL